VEIPDMDARRTADREMQQAEGCELVCDEAAGIEESEVLLGRKTRHLKVKPPDMGPIEGLADKSASEPARTPPIRATISDDIT
jgi:hypothetical protein